MGRPRHPRPPPRPSDRDPTTTNPPGVDMLMTRWAPGSGAQLRSHAGRRVGLGGPRTGGGYGPTVETGPVALIRARQETPNALYLPPGILVRAVTKQRNPRPRRLPERRRRPPIDPEVPPTAPPAKPFPRTEVTPVNQPPRQCRPTVLKLTLPSRYGESLGRKTERSFRWPENFFGQVSRSGDPRRPRAPPRTSMEPFSFDDTITS